MARREGTVPYRWSLLPEQRGWMLANAGGRPVAEVCEDFEREFGTPINRTQVSQFRAAYGLQRRRGNRTAHRRKVVPIGSEKESRGYVQVKVRDLPSVPGSHDNWVFKHRLVWERANGRPVPEGHIVMFADGDKANFDPANLVAVPRSCIGPLNGSGLKWTDAATLEAAVAVVKLKGGMMRAVNRPRRCGVCGREFTPDNHSSKYRYSQRTCRECLDKGLRSKKVYAERSPVCPVCGKRFTTTHPLKIYCSKKCQTAEMYRRTKERKARGMGESK